MAAQFPTAVATDTDLLVAMNRKQTNLVGNLNASDTAFTLAADVFAVNVAITIGSEIILILTKTGAHVDTCTRGYDGTSAASHVDASLVSAYIDAHHHNQLADEVKAIETALGANLANVAVTNPLTVAKGGTGVQTLTGIPVGSGTSAFSVVAASLQLQYLRRKGNITSTTYEFVASPIKISTDHDFPLQAPAENISPSLRTVTMVPAPLGVNATNTAHYVGIYNNAGAWQENVLINGGSAVAGASGTLTFASIVGTYAAGSYKIGSATAGIQEGIWAAGNASLFIPAGSHAPRATATVPTSISPEIYGAGGLSTSIAPVHTTGDVITWAASNSIQSFYIHDLSFTSGARSSGAFIGQRGGMVSGTIRDIYTSGGYDAIVIEGGNGCFTRGLHIVGNSHYGVYIHATGVMGGRHEGWTISGAPGCVANLAIQAETGGAIAGLQFNTLSLQTAQFNIISNANGGPTNEMLFSNTILDSATTMAAKFFGTTASNIVKFGGELVVETNGGGLFDVYSNIYNFSIEAAATMSVSSGVTGITLNGVKNCSISGVIASGGGTADALDVSLKLTTDGSEVCDGVRVSGCKFGFNGTGGTTGAVAAAGLYIPTTGHRNIVIENTDFYGSTFGAIVDNNDVSPRYVGFCRGLSDTVPTVASAATVTFPRMILGGQVTVTGTTNITAVAGLYAGQYGTVLATGGTITAASGATIGNSFIFQQNVPAWFFFDGTKVWWGAQSPALANTRNYIATEGGANNAITGTLTGVTLGTGLSVTVKLAHTLQAGANTFNLNGGGAVGIKSSRNPANNIGTAYAATGTVTLLYDSTGPYWLDVSQ